MGKHDRLHRFKRVWSLALALVVVAAACGQQSTPMPTAEPVGTPPARATTVAGTPSSPPILLPTCLPTYSRVVDEGIGFLACYPEGWAVSKREDGNEDLRRVSFSQPAQDGGIPGFRSISLTVSPHQLGASDDEVLRSLSQWLVAEGDMRLRTRPHLITVDGHKAADVSFTTSVALGRAIVHLAGRTTIIVQDGYQWVIESAAAVDIQDETEATHEHFLETFRFLVTST